MGTVASPPSSDMAAWKVYIDSAINKALEKEKKDLGNETLEAPIASSSRVTIEEQNVSQMDMTSGGE